MTGRHRRPSTGEWSRSPGALRSALGYPPWFDIRIDGRVYRGSDRVGQIARTGDRWHAFDRAGLPLRSSPDIDRAWADVLAGVDSLHVEPSDAVMPRLPWPDVPDNPPGRCTGHVWDHAETFPAPLPRLEGPHRSADSRDSWACAGGHDLDRMPTDDLTPRRVARDTARRTPPEGHRPWLTNATPTTNAATAANAPPSPAAPSAASTAAPPHK